MTSAPINDYSVMPVYRKSQGGDGQVSNQNEDAAGSFKDAMDQAKGSQAGGVKESTAKVSGTGGVMRTTDAFSVKSDTAKVQKTEAAEKTDETQKTESVSDSGKTEDAKEAVEQTAEDVEKEVVEKIAEELGVTEDEVKEAMEILGFTVMDLMDQGNMAALVTQLMGEEDSTALLTDENLFATIRQLTEAVGGIIEENVHNLSEELDVDVDEVIHMVQDALEQEELSPEAEERGVVVEIDGELVPEKANEASKAVREAPETPEEAEEKTGTVKPENITEEQTAGQNRGMMNSGQESTPLLNQMYRPEAFVSESVDRTELPFTSYVDTADIINQIGEYVKIHQSEGVSQMEILLNPESLGSIHLQVVAREGAITATITAQNEAVREALMVQAMTLKEELNEQGMKVEAVEVTVASHEFERNMENGGEEAKNLFEEQVQKQTRRRIVINNLKQAEEMLADEELSDAEKLQIDMMAKSGNSVDFTA